MGELIQIVPTNRPGFITPLGSKACLTRSASAQSGRGSPQTRSPAFQAVGQRGRVRLPPSRTAWARRRSSSGASASSSIGPGACPRTIPLPACRLDGPAPGVEVLDQRDDRRRPDVGREADRPRLERRKLGQGRPQRPGVDSRADDHLGRAQLVTEPIDLPRNRRRVVLEPDRQHPAPDGQPERLRPPCGLRSGSRARQPSGEWPRC